MNVCTYVGKNEKTTERAQWYYCCDTWGLSAFLSILQNLPLCQYVWLYFTIQWISYFSRYSHCYTLHTQIECV